MPIPISVFPSAYRNDTTTTDETKVEVEGEVDVSSRRGRDGQEEKSTTERRESRIYVENEDRPSRREKEVRIEGVDRDRRERDVDIDIEVDRRRYSEPRSRRVDTEVDIEDRTYDREYRTTRDQPTRYDTEIDVTEREFRRHTRPIAEEYTGKRYEQEVTVDGSRRDMGYYDEDGHYHSFRHGVHKAADRLGDRIAHPIHGSEHHHGHHHHEHGDRIREEVDVDIDIDVPRSSRSVRYLERSGPPHTITIPCHHIRVGDLLILQGRPCNVIRITTSAQTGQYRYLGVDLFTKQLQEESSFVSNPSPSVIVQNMLGPVFKQYRVLDITPEGRVVAMTETGDVKQNLQVLEQGELFRRLENAFANGRGSVRVLVINDSGRELAVDYKVLHGSRL